MRRVASTMTRRVRMCAGLLSALLLLTAGAGAQDTSPATTPVPVTKPTVAGVTNFAKLQSTIACAGATTSVGVAEVKKMGYRSIINLREATEPGSDVEGASAAARQAGIKYVHLPFNSGSPDPAVVEQFLQAVADPSGQPVFVHCASGNRAAALWMIKRLVVDGWEADAAATEAAALGLTSPALKTFALNYAQGRKP